VCKCVSSCVMAVAVIAIFGGCASYHNHVNPMEKKIAQSVLVSGQEATRYRQSEMIGAGIGALAESMLDNYQNRLESELRQKIQGSGIVIEREGHSLRLLLPAGDTFAEMGAEISPRLYPALDALSGILGAYRQTMIEVIGYADMKQPGQHRLPERRAAEISSYLVEQKLQYERFELVGLERQASARRGRYTPAVQAEIRLLPLQRSLSMQPKERGTPLLNAGLFLAL